MNKIGKRVIAGALAMCAVFSTTTAFAAPVSTYAVETPVLTVNTYCAPEQRYYRVRGESTAEVTQYSNHFEVKTTVLSPTDAKIDEIGVKYIIINQKTGERYGKVHDYFEYNSNSAWDFYSVPLEKLPSAYVKCRHFAYQSSVTLMSSDDGVTVAYPE